MGTLFDKLSYPLDQIDLDPEGRKPLQRQLCDQLRELILGGVVVPESRLPSIRTLASELMISRNTVVNALDQLSAEGLVESRRGSGNYVARISMNAGRRTKKSKVHSQPPPLSQRGEIMTSQPRVRTFPGHTAFHPGLPDLAHFPFKTWSRLLTRRARSGGQDLFGYHYISGYPKLRSMISTYLSTMRRVRCSPDQVVITTGGQAALDLLARLLIAEGDTVLMEEPGYIGARSAFLGAGARLQPLHVDRSGWRLSATGYPHARLIYLTPSCQHPLGVTMPAEQRMAIIDIAHANNAWIIEDDFDGEYNFRGQPLPAMQGLNHSRVIYVGTFAKTLFPAMRLGFFVAPEDLAQRIKAAINFTGQYAPLFLQAALADFIEQGYFFIHLNKMRRLYARRRARFLALLESYLGEWLEPIDGRTGIQIASLLRFPLDDREIVKRAASQRISLAPLSMFFMHESFAAGLLMGYASATEADMERLFPLLRQVLAGTSACDRS